MTLQLLLTLLILASCSTTGNMRSSWPEYSVNPFVIQLDVPGPEDSAGGLIVADLNGDGRMDYLVTVPNYITAHAHDGRKLWTLETNLWIGGSSERIGLPGHHGPGVQAADIDGDKQVEVLFLTQDGTLHVVDGATGREQWTAKPPIPKGTQRWEHLVLANFRGAGDRDLLLQTTNTEGYRMGRFLAAYELDDLRRGHFAPLWERDDFVSCAHNGARLADLNRDGQDEVIGATVVSADGEILLQIPLRGHIDSIFIYDVLPNVPGLEIVALEEGGGNRIFLYNHEQIFWETHFRHQEPQNAAVGEFDLERPGLEIWCRSRYNEHQKPFIFDAQGEKIADYQMDDVAPEGWTARGVEVIHKIDWTGDRKQLAAAKERHTSGDIGIFDPLSGQFLHRFEEKADRLYVADVAGDWREELIVLHGNQLHIYFNESENPVSDHPRLWSQDHYRRSKMTWNYYSP